MQLFLITTTWVNFPYIISNHKVSANKRRHYICNVLFYWPRPCQETPHFIIRRLTYFQVRHIQVPTHDDRFLGVQALEVIPECWVPLHTIIQPHQFTTSIWNILKTQQQLACYFQYMNNMVKILQKSTIQDYFIHKKFPNVFENYTFKFTARLCKSRSSVHNRWKIGPMKNMQRPIKLLYVITFEILKIQKWIFEPVKHEKFQLCLYSHITKGFNWGCQV